MEETTILKCPHCGRFTECEYLTARNSEGEIDYQGRTIDIFAGIGGYATLSLRTRCTECGSPFTLAMHFDFDCYEASMGKRSVTFSEEDIRDAIRKMHRREEV